MNTADLDREPTPEDLARDLEADLAYVEPTIWAEAACRRAIAAERDLNGLNRMLRDTGYGQGQIDAYVTQCEDLAEAVRLLRLWVNFGVIHGCKRDDHLDAFLAKHQEAR